MRNRLGSLYAAAFGSLALVITPAAFAQVDEDPEGTTAETPANPGDVEDTSDEALSEEADAETEPTAPEAEVATEAEASGSTAASTASAATVGDASTAPPPGSAPEDEPSEGEGLRVTLEVVPASGYPSWKVRGIPGGSLATTMHGMQWPYLPAKGDEETLRLGVSGFVWTDLSYVRIESGLEDSYPNQKRLATQARGVLRISPTFSTPEGWFAQGQWEAVGHGDMLIQNSNLASTDDLYVRVGKWKVFDFTAGRFQGWEIANHYGMGLDLNTLERNGAAIEAQAAKPVPAYGLTYYWDRKDGRLGHYALHLYPTDFLRFEMLAELGTGTEGILRQTNLRPVGVLDLGFLKVKGGLEYGVALPQGDDEKRRIFKNGFGVAVQGVFDPWLEGGISFARGYEDLIDIQGNRVMVHLVGACSGCQMAGMTLGGVQQQLMEELGEFVKVVPASQMPKSAMGA